MTDTLLNRDILIAPSLLSADFANLADACSLMERAGADLLHCDVMDGHFVPNLTFGPPVIKAIHNVTTLPLDVHLMIDNADTTVDWYLDAGAAIVTLHAETCQHLHRTLSRIKDAGAYCAVSLNPATPVSTIGDVLELVDMVLLMSVNPGFGGQSFIMRTVDKCKELVDMCEARGCSPLIQIDGGINIETAPLVTKVGARCLVAGNAVFGAADPIEAVVALRKAALHV